MRPNFSRSVMASVGISALGHMSIQFVDPGVKVNGDYYHNVLLRQGLLPEMREQKMRRFGFLEHGEFHWFFSHSCFTR